MNELVLEEEEQEVEVRVRVHNHLGLVGIMTNANKKESSRKLLDKN